jgi:hypothetical protein
MSAKIIVIDFFSVVSEIDRVGRNLVGKPAPGLVDYVRSEQAVGSTVFVIAGAAHDPFFRQKVEHFLEGIGIRSVFVTHGLPDGFTLFISSRAFKFDGERFPSP